MIAHVVANIVAIVVAGLIGAIVLAPVVIVVMLVVRAVEAWRQHHRDLSPNGSGRAVTRPQPKTRRDELDRQEYLRIAMGGTAVQR